MESGTEMAGRWFVLAVRPQRERLASGRLSQLGIGHSYRTETVHRNGRRGRPVAMRVPLLPGYIPFIVSAEGDPYEYRDRACAGCPFIKGLVVRKSDRKPAQLRADWEEWLRAPPEPRAPMALDYQPGDRVRLTAFPFVGMLADCTGILRDENNNPVQVEIDMPGMLGARRVVLPAHDAKRAA